MEMIARIFYIPNRKTYFVGQQHAKITSATQITHPIREVTYKNVLIWENEQMRIAQEKK